MYSDKWYADAFQYSNADAYMWDPNHDGTGGEWCGDWLAQDGWGPAPDDDTPLPGHALLPWTEGWQNVNNYASAPYCDPLSHNVRLDRPHLVPSFSVGRLPIYSIQSTEQEHMLKSVLNNYVWLFQNSGASQSWYKRVIGFSTILNTLADDPYAACTQKADSSVNNQDIIEAQIQQYTNGGFAYYNINERGENVVDDDDDFAPNYAGYQQLAPNCTALPSYPHTYCYYEGDESIGDATNNGIRARELEGGLMAIFAEGPSYYYDQRTIWADPDGDGKIQLDASPPEVDADKHYYLFHSGSIMLSAGGTNWNGPKKIATIMSCNGGNWDHLSDQAGGPEFNLAEAFIYGGIASSVIANSNVWHMFGDGDGGVRGMYGGWDIAGQFLLDVATTSTVGDAYHNVTTYNGPPTDQGSFHNVMTSNLFGDPRLHIGW